MLTPTQFFNHKIDISYGCGLYRAVLDGYDGAPDATGIYSCVGSGKTEQDALGDLREMVVDDAEILPVRLVDFTVDVVCPHCGRKDDVMVWRSNLVKNSVSNCCIGCDKTFTFTNPFAEVARRLVGQKEQTNGPS